MVKFEAHRKVVVNRNHYHDVAKLEAYQLGGKSLTHVVRYNESHAYIGGNHEDEVRRYIHLVDGHVKHKGYDQQDRVDPSCPLQVAPQKNNANQQKEDGTDVLCNNDKCVSVEPLIIFWCVCVVLFDR